MTSRAYPPPETTRSKTPILALLGALALLAALLPLAMRLDGNLDATRTMYTDRQAMAFLQHLGVSAGIEPVETKLGPGEELVLGEKRFTPSPGVTVLVRRKDGVGEEGEPVLGYCVRSRNEEGENTPWLCHDALHPPAEPSGDPLAEL